MVGHEDDRKKNKSKIQSDFDKLKEVIVSPMAGKLEDLRMTLRSEAVRRVARALQLGLLSAPKHQAVSASRLFTAST